MLKMYNWKIKRSGLGVRITGDIKLVGVEPTARGRKITAHSVEVINIGRRTAIVASDKNEHIIAELMMTE